MKRSVKSVKRWSMKPITDLSVERVNNDQSALFNNPLNSAQILAGNGRFKISVPNGIEVGTFDNTTFYFPTHHGGYQWVT